MRDAPIRAAAFGVAGPGRPRPGETDEYRLARRGTRDPSHLGTPHVRLLNDLEATALSIEILAADEVFVLQEGTEDTGAGAAVISAGTGLGQAYLHRRNGRLIPAPSEGGHADFAARTDREAGTHANAARQIRPSGSGTGLKRTWPGEHLSADSSGRASAPS